jgi:hypothetical protein
VRVSIAALVVGLACGCGAQGLAPTSTTAPETFATQDNPLLKFDPGNLRMSRAEHWVARFDLLGVTAGTLDAIAQPSCPDTPGNVLFVSRIRTSGVARLVKRVEAELLTLASVDGALPTQSSMGVSEGQEQKIFEVDFRPGSYLARLLRADGSVDERASLVPDGADAHDVQSAIHLMRSWRPNAGARAHFYLVSGRYLFRTNLLFHGMDVIVVGGSPRPAVRVDGEAQRFDAGPKQAYETRKFSLWVSDDAYRTPLRIQAESYWGSLVLELISHEPETAITCDELPAPRASAGPPWSLEPAASQEPAPSIQP